MTAPLLPRRAILLLLGGGMLAALPLAPRAAWAGGDDGDDDNRGRGRGRGGDHDDDDRNDDRDDDRSGPGGGGDDDDRDESRDRVEGNDSEVGGSGRSGDRPDRLRDVTVLYPDGWVERVVSGRYELIDARQRLVVTRPATAEDMTRMLALR